MHTVFADNGEKGLASMFREFMLEQKLERASRAQHKKESEEKEEIERKAREAKEAAKDRKLNRSNTVIAALMLVLAIISAVYVALEFNRQKQEHLLHFPKIFHTSETDPVLARVKPQTQDADGATPANETTHYGR